MCFFCRRRPSRRYFDGGPFRHLAFVRPRRPTDLPQPPPSRPSYTDVAGAGGPNGRNGNPSTKVAATAGRLPRRGIRAVRFPVDSGDRRRRGSDRHTHTAGDLCVLTARRPVGTRDRTAAAAAALRAAAAGGQSKSPRINTAGPLSPTGVNARAPA